MASFACGSTKIETVASIFRNMSLEEEMIDESIGKKLIDDDFSEVLKIPFPFFSGFPSFEVSIPQIEKFVEWLIENKNDLATALVILKYTWNNAVLIINKFIDCIQFYKIEYQINPCGFEEFHYFTCCGKDTLSVIQNIARSFFINGRTVLYSSKLDKLHPFYCMIGKRCRILGFGKNLFVVDPQNYAFSFLSEWVDQNPITNVLPVLLRDSASTCSVIITEDGDISAAADCITKSICQSQVQESFSVSHIFIQESVYELTVSVLKDKLSGIKFGNRFDKKTELELLPHGINDTSHENNLEVFSPCEGSPVKLCVGWNPKDIDEANKFSKCEGYIIVIPYRNVAEMKSLIKDNIKPMSPTGVWSERINVIGMDLEDQFSFVWINCHGLVHPLTISKSPSFTLIDSPYSEEDGKRSQADLESYQLQNDLIKKGYINWQKRKATLQIKLLNMIKETWNCEDCLSNSKMDLNKLMSLVDEDGKASYKAKCSFSVKPVGIILIFVLFDYDDSSLFDDLRKIVITALINGNSVSIGGSYESIKIFKQCLLDLLQLLPDGVLTFREGLSELSFLSSFKGIPFIPTYLFTEGNLITVFDVTLVWKIVIGKPTNYLCNSFLSDITSITQGTWIA